ncbi:GNAT family N-acetyltransferase [Vibrio sp. ZSDZ34]|uniref:GNAT family N-acetyltransferase n=1 Tax=Vibrio gelatinilyticus TaxID=2893468 RepID=A0A9X2B0I4_9VIBR|nr:GNAT family N-acetyltransferase [Vibrio gelatinilyticus]MCJ2378852.1 GNAT family N-acetyltransferase [Vibrio gelatinilyticus]
MDTLKFGILDPIRLPIAKKLYKQHYPAGRPKADERIISARFESATCALVRLRSVDSYRLMTGMLVLPEYRQRGVGHQLMNYLMRHELQLSDFCFSLTDLAPFYAQHGFQAISQDELPAALKTLFIRYTGSGKSLVAMRYIDPS